VGPGRSSHSRNECSCPEAVSRASLQAAAGVLAEECRWYSTVSGGARRRQAWRLLHSGRTYAPVWWGRVSILSRRPGQGTRRGRGCPPHMRACACQFLRRCDWHRSLWSRLSGGGGFCRQAWRRDSACVERAKAGTGNEVRACRRFCTVAGGRAGAPAPGVQGWRGLRCSTASRGAGRRQGCRRCRRGRLLHGGLPVGGQWMEGQKKLLG